MFRTSLSTLVGLALVIVAPGVVAAQNEAPESTRTVIVSGTGQASAEPDEAVIRIGVDVRGTDAGSTMRKSARRMDAVIAALQDVGVEETDIRTVRLDLDQYRRRGADREVVERGWQVTNRISATIRDIGGASDAIDAAVAAGATDIDSIRFRASDPSSAIADARVAAIGSAAVAASTLAEASGLEVLDVVRIVEAGNRLSTRYEPFLADSASFAAEAFSYSTPIEPGLVDVSTSVTVEYEIG